MNEIIDLTYPIEEGMLTFHTHWHPQVSIEQLGKIEIEGRESRKIIFGTHTGTHVDAPLHFISNGKSIDEIPLTKLNGKITIFNFSHLEENTPITKKYSKIVQFLKKFFLNLDGKKTGELPNFILDIHFLLKKLQNFWFQRMLN